MSMYRHIASAYGSTKQTLDKLYHRRRPDTYERTLGDLTATFDVREYRDWRFVTNLNEASLISRFNNHVSHDATVWDVGGHIGMWTCFLAEAVPDGEVVVFEPHPENVAAIVRNTALNSTHHVDVEAVALGAESDELQLFEDTDSSAHSLNGGGKSVTVPVVRGDNVAARRGYPDALKLDVEGAEVGALRGMPDVLDRVTLVMCEIHPMHGVERDDVTEIFDSHGLKWTETTHRGQPILWAHR